MKKTLLMIAFTMLGYAVSAQDIMTNKKGTHILPDSADWAIGFDAAPAFKMIGNIFYSSNDTADWFTANNPALTIFGKKCVTADKFYRAGARIAYGNETQNYPVRDDITFYDTTSNNETFDNDQQKFSYMQINLSGGIEKRLGTGRVQGYYGPEVSIGYGSSKITNTFYNRLVYQSTDSSTTADSSAIFSENGLTKRITEISNGSTFSFGVRGFAGVEYFLGAKIAIGAEFGWGILFASRGAGETSSEFYDPAYNNGAGGNRTQTSEGPGKHSSFKIDTDQAYGALNLIFYFGGGAVAAAK